MVGNSDHRRWPPYSPKELVCRTGGATSVSFIANLNCAGLGPSPLLRQLSHRRARWLQHWERERGEVLPPRHCPLPHVVELQRR